MKEEIKKFNQYAKQFDLREKAMMNKYHHSFRVMEFCKEIAISIGLNEQDINIVCLCGLLHDIARFEQWTQYQTYHDEKSFDHGDYGYDILKKDDFIKEFTTDEEIQSIVLQSVKHHNKLTVPSLKKKELLFAQIVRDADKLDIMKEQGNKITSDEIVLNPNLLQSIYNGEICKNKDIQTEEDSIVRMLSWVFDFNFKYAYQYLMEHKIIEQKFNLLEMYGTTEEIEQLKQFIYGRIGEKLC